MIGTWYEHEVPVPDGTRFKTGASATHPWWKIEGRWFSDGANECVIGSSLAANYPGGIAIGKTIYVAAQNASGRQSELRPLVVVGIVSTGDSEDNALLTPLSVAQTLSGHPGQIRQVYVSALTKPADALAERDPHSLTPTEYDQWFCSPYISSISYQIGQVLPGTDVRAIRRVAETEGRVLSHVSTLLWIVTLAALIAAALAVAATSAATVLQRRSEIGIMKAIGATNTLVGGIFLAEQLMLAIAGGAIGFLFGIGLARILGSSVFGTPAAPRLVLLPVILGLAAIVAIAGSLIPLRRAAHFNPAPILRGE
jgi:putative ABC transport system permease protein